MRKRRVPYFFLVSFISIFFPYFCCLIAKNGSSSGLTDPCFQLFAGVTSFLLSSAALFIMFYFILFFLESLTSVFHTEIARTLNTETIFIAFYSPIV